MQEKKNYKKIFGIIGATMFVGSAVFVKVINVYDFFIENRFIVGFSLSIIMFISLILMFKYLDVFKYKN